MEVKKGYKQTEFGIIPNDWDAISVQELMDSNAIVGHLDGNHGALYPRSNEFVEFGVPYITANELTGYKVNFRTCKYLSEERARRFRKGVAKNGDVLFAHNATVGPTALLSTELYYVILSTTATYFRCNPEKIKNTFLLYALQSQHFVTQYQAVMAQSTRNQVPITTQRKLFFILPSALAEQEAIAEALSDADALVEALEQLLAKKRQVKQGVMQELLTGKRRLPGFEKRHGSKKTDVGIVPEDWDSVSLGSLCTMKSGDGITSAGIDQFSPYPCYGGNGLRGFTSRFTHDGNYALIGRVGALCGNVLGVRGQFFASEHAIVVTPLPKTDVGWLTFKLGEMHLNQYAEASAQPVLTVTKLLKLKVACPSTKEEQTAIAKILSDMDAEIAALEGKLSKARQVKAGMMSVLLTGKIRLVES